MSGDHRHGTARAAFVTLAVNLALTAAKWAAFAFTGSPSLFGEAAHSTADSLNPLVLWIGHRRGGRSADGRHPLGHGRESFFWSLIAALMMLAIGAVSTAYHGIGTLLEGGRPHASAWALSIAALALVGESVSLAVVWRRLREESRGRDVSRSRNTVLLALLVENGIDILGVLLALAGYGLYLLTGDPRWDACFSLLIAGLLAASSFFLINRSRSLIIGEAGPDDVVAKVTGAALARPSVSEVRNVVTVMNGPHDIGCRIAVRWNAEWLAGASRTDGEPTGAGAAERTAAMIAAETVALKADIAAAAPEVADIVVETI